MGKVDSGFSSLTGLLARDDIFPKRCHPCAKPANFLFMQAIFLMID